MNMSSTIDFIRLLDSELEKFPDAKVIVRADHGVRELTNAVFLIGAYMIIKMEKSPAEVMENFQSLDPETIESYRDATFACPDFRLHLADCWRGLTKGRELGWIRHGDANYLWGDIDVDEYRHYDSPANGNLHEVVPGKFIALQGPRDLGGAEYRDDEATGARTFSPEFYAAVLHDMGADTVVRLNEPRYSATSLTAGGFVHHDLEFEDCTCPPDAVVEAFLRADAAEGAVAVHCHAGLGRTGTLIGLWLMRSRGFTAREAMGWLRIMRPGSVIGEQQRYLCSVEAAQQHAAAFAPPDLDGPAHAAHREEASRAEGGAAELAAQVAAGMARRRGLGGARSTAGDA